MVEKRVRVVAAAVVVVVVFAAAGAVGVDGKEKGEGSGDDDGKPDDDDNDDGGWKDESSATATAVGLGATPVLLLPLVDADIALLWCVEGRGSECVTLGPLPGTNPPPWPPSPPSIVVARLHAASVAASIETRVASACAGETARSSRRRDPRSSSPIESESQLSQGAGRDMAACRVSEKEK